MALFKKIKSSSIRSKVMEAVEPKIAEAEAAYRESCELADQNYHAALESAAIIRNRHKAESEQNAVDSIVSKL